MALSPEESRERARQSALKAYYRDKDTEEYKQRRREQRARRKEEGYQKRPRQTPEEKREKARQRAKAWHHANKGTEEFQQNRANRRKRERDNDEYRKKAREWMQEWRKLHPPSEERRQRDNARTMEYYRLHKDKRQTEEYRERLCEIAKKYYHLRRATKLEVGGIFTSKDIARIYDAQKGRCAACQEKFKTTGANRYCIDHIIPLMPKEGQPRGTNGPENLQLLCRSCNCRKYNLQPEEWNRRRKSIS